jgi:hypothetical protein
MSQEKSNVWCQFCFLIPICVILIIQCAVFISTKGNIIPSIGVRNGTTERCCCLVHDIDLWNDGAFDARLRGEYKDGRTKYGDIVSGLGGSNSLTNPFHFTERPPAESRWVPKATESRNPG